MRQKAFQVYSQFRTNNIIPTPYPHHGQEYEADELALFGGQTRVLVSKLLKAHKHRKSTPSNSTPNFSSPSPSEADSSRSSNSSSDQTQDVHPSLVEYLSGFPPSQTHSPESMEQTYSQQDAHIQSNSAAQSPSHQQHEQSSWPSWSAPSLYTALPPETYANIVSNNDNNSIPYPQEVMGQPPGQLTYQQAPPDNANALVDLGMMMSGESGMDEQWMSFMRDSGLLQINPGTMTNYAMPPSEIPIPYNQDMSQPRIY